MTNELKLTLNPGQARNSKRKRVLRIAHIEGDMEENKPERFTISLKVEADNRGVTAAELTRDDIQRMGQFFLRELS